jgi:chromosome segregation ATPase
MFLSDRLDKLSEEGIKEMISENVELKTGLAVMQRDNKALKRKVKELEKRLKDDEERPSTAVSGTSTGESPRWFDQDGAQEREEELTYLRERVEEYVIEIEKLRKDSVIRENEKRNLAEVVRNMGERRTQDLDSREEMDVWKDLLEQETSRREQADEDNKKLREEIFRLKSEPGATGLNHTTNIYNITKKRQASPSRPYSGHSNHIDDRNGAVSSATTLVDELRRESEQLRHENAELRREVGAQTNMLTSRNREKERLYQEIEDLKLGQRRGGGSIAGDSIFERSASRAHQRSLSRTSAGTRQTVLTDSEREDLENKNSELRDSLNALKIQNQDLQRELESCMEDFETAVAQKKQAEALATEMQEALEVAENDLLTMQADRDEALQGQEETELMFESLRKEAEEANAEIERLQTELQDTTENFNALQNEMREMSEALVRLEDDHEAKSRRINELENEIEESNKELEQMDKNLVESNTKLDRLSVQQESAQGEIAFLREEQDGDKIKIGDLEAAVKHLEQSLHDESQRAKDIEQRLGNERHQREVIASKEKQEIQQYVNNLNREITTAQDDARRLRKSLSHRETEAAEWKSRLTDLESNLREALGDLDGTRSSMFTVSVANVYGINTHVILVHCQTAVRGGEFFPRTFNYSRIFGGERAFDKAPGFPAGITWPRIAKTGRYA